MGRGAAPGGPLGPLNPFGSWLRLIPWDAPFTPGLGVHMGLEFGLVNLPLGWAAALFPPSALPPLRPMFVGWGAADVAWWRS